MAKKVIVGGRIESKEVGGIVTGAAEILDDSKGKKQSIINQETDAELQRLDGAKQDVLTFDNTPTERSNNPVTSGGVYAADKALSDAIEAILLLIPSAASALNKLVDQATMNSSISTATATFRGTYNVVTDLELTVDATHEQIAAKLAQVVSEADNNDYAFVQVPVSAESTDIRRTERYKFNGTAWAYEYDLNTSGFTAAQWAAINSGITLALVAKLSGLPTSSELMALLGQKQDTLTFDNIPTNGSANPVKSGGVYSAINDEKTAREQLAQSVAGINGRLGNVEEVIPSGAAANNKLVANSSMEAYVTSIIEAITASFTIATADGHINLTLTQTNGQVASLTLTSSDIASAQALTALTGRVTTAEGNITSLGGRVSTNETDIANLQQLYNNLQQSKPVPVTALPSTGQQQGVIYRLAGTTSYSDYMWNGSTWVLMATYNNAIDPRPKKASQNLVTSGGVFDNMGALDVSELNATENPHTLAQYVDLSAALAAIPTDYQKGGMSIKFVQTSDNKYVQARLMANSFTTDITQWQGVDDEPTAGSGNLVKSGGVKGYNFSNEITTISTTTRLFDNSIVKGGNIVYYKIENTNNEACFIQVTKSDSSKDYYGMTDSVHKQIKEGSFVLPNNYTAVDFVTNYPSIIYYIFTVPVIPNSILNSIQNVEKDLIEYRFSEQILSVSYGTRLLNSEDGFDGKICYYKFTNANNKTGYLQIVKNNVTYKTIGATESAPSKTYEGYFIIPNGYNYIRIVGDANVTLDYFYVAGAIIENTVHGIQNDIKNVETKLGNQLSNNPVLLTQETLVFNIPDDVNIGETIYYKIENHDNEACFLQAKDTNGNVIASYGILSSQPKQIYEDCFVVPINTKSIYINGAIQFKCYYCYTSNTIALKDHQRVSKDVSLLKEKKFNLLNRYKDLNVVNENEVFVNRPQFKITSYKSFTPAIDYRGLIAFEGFDDYTTFDIEKPILFEEHLLTYNWNNLNGSRLYSYITKNLKDFMKYESPITYNFQNLNLEGGYGVGGNENGLVITEGYSDTYGNLFLWSLDGGRTFEPMTERIRAKVSINATEITQEGMTVVVDGETLYAISVETAQSYLSSYSAPTVAEKQEYARNYLADKILIGHNEQDKLRSLAYLLIERGYKVRLTSNSLFVYYKEFGTIGNGKQITVDGVSKTFTGGQDITPADVIQYIHLSGSTGLTYNDGSNILLSDIQEAGSCNYIDGKWYFTCDAIKGGSYEDGKPSAVINVIVDEPESIENSNISCQKISESILGTNAYQEPIMSYNKYYNLMLIGLRPQNGTKQMYVYSKDKGLTWSELIELPENIKQWQTNVALFVVRNPMINNPGVSGVPYFYDNINANTKNMLVALSYDRRRSVIFASTASIDLGIEKAVWSDWVPLNRDSEFLNNCGYENLDMYFSDVSGYGCIGGFTYAPLHKGLVLLYVGSKAVTNTWNEQGNPIWTWLPMITLEEC